MEKKGGGGAKEAREKAADIAQGRRLGGIWARQYTVPRGTKIGGAEEAEERRRGSGFWDEM